MIINIHDSPESSVATYAGVTPWKVLICEIRPREQEEFFSPPLELLIREIDRCLEATHLPHSTEDHSQ